MAGQDKPFALVEGHILKGELMGRGRHLAPSNHTLTGLKTKILHGKVFRTDRFAKSAEAAGIDQLIGLAGTDDDGFVIVDFPGVFFRIGPEPLQVDTDLDTFQALALEAASGFLNGLIIGVA